MDILSSFSWMSVWILVQVVVIDLVMSGDNALMITMTTQYLKKPERRKAIFWGVIVVALFTIAFAFLLFHALNYPRLKLIGGVLLLGICAKLYKQFRDNANGQPKHTTGRDRVHALELMIIGNISMSLDNILAVASAASGHPRALLIGIGLAVVLMMSAANRLSKIITRFPRVQWIGFVLIVFVAIKLLLAGSEAMITINNLPIILRWIGAMVALIGIIFWHRQYISDYEINEVAPLLYRHAPFIITVLLLIIAAFLLYGEGLHQWLLSYPAALYTACICLLLLILEMISLERVKWKNLPTK